MKHRPVIYNNIPDGIRRKRMKGLDLSKSTAVRQTGYIAMEIKQAISETGYNFNGIHKPENTNDNYSVAYSLFPFLKAVRNSQK